MIVFVFSLAFFVPLSCPHFWCSVFLHHHPFFVFLPKMTESFPSHDTHSSESDDFDELSLHSDDFDDDFHFGFSLSDDDEMDDDDDSCPDDDEDEDEEDDKEEEEEEE